MAMITLYGVYRIRGSHSGAGKTPESVQIFFLHFTSADLPIENRSIQT
jgi:hypothetical protein